MYDDMLYVQIKFYARNLQRPDMSKRRRTWRLYETWAVLLAITVVRGVEKLMLKRLVWMLNQNLRNSVAVRKLRITAMVHVK